MREALAEYEAAIAGHPDVVFLAETTGEALDVYGRSLVALRDALTVLEQRCAGAQSDITGMAVGTLRNAQAKSEATFGLAVARHFAAAAEVTS